MLDGAGKSGGGVGWFHANILSALPDINYYRAKAQLTDCQATIETMSQLSKVFVFKIAATIIFWCVPLIFMPASIIELADFPKQETYMFVRMLGWAYLALCVGYWFGLQASLQGKRAMGPIWVGIVSNGGAFLYLTYYGVSGAWAYWGSIIQFVGWSSVGATFVITLGLFLFGVRGPGEAA